MCFLKSCYKNINLISRTGKISCPSVAAVVLPAARAAREKEDDKVETSDVLLVFAL